jgi:hypothetical protein
MMVPTYLIISTQNYKTMMQFYNSCQDIPYIWRCIEGLTTGCMMLSHVFFGKWNFYSVFILLIHWYFSYRFHMTYTTKDKENDQLWIQFIACERLALCNPKIAMLPKIASFPLFFPNLSFSKKTVSISLFCLFTNVFSLYWTCNGKGLIFLYWMFLSFLFFLLSDSSWLGQYCPPKRFKEIRRSPIMCVLFHLSVGIAQSLDCTKECCNEIKPLYPQIFDLVYYIFSFWVFENKSFLL